MLVWARTARRCPRVIGEPWRYHKNPYMSIGKTEFARRRKNLMALMEPNSIAIIPSAREKVRSRDTLYSFRQDSDFYYLSGFAEPDAV